MAQDIITISDTAFAGRLGELAIGAIALGGIFYLAIVMMGFGFGIGIQVLISRRYGENRPDKIKSTWFHSVLLMVAFSLVTFTILRIWAPTIISKVVESQEIYSNTVSFFNVRIFGLFAAFINIAFRALFIGIGNTKIISYSTLIMAAINVLFNYLLMFGIGVFPNLGLIGAAYASIIAELIACLIFILYTFNSKQLKSYLPIPISRTKINDFLNIIKISTPTMLQNLISFGGWFVFFLLVEKMGTEELAISNIIRSIYIILLLPIMGFSSAANTLTSQAIGMKNYKIINSIAKNSLSLCIFGTLILVGLANLIPTQIISTFTSSQDLINSTLPVFYVISVASIFLASGFVLFSVVTATGNTKTALAIEVFSISIYLIGVYAIIHANMRIYHVWMLEAFYGSSLAIISIIYLKFGNWKDKVI